MNSLFQNAKIGRLELRNRFIRAAAHEGLADSRGAPTTGQSEFYPCSSPIAAARPARASPEAACWHLPPSPVASTGSVRMK
jgi:hypothetical protein